ncbi:MAG: hypothetical protein RDU89_02890 [bacterium]|nr:hypothetical protein [bacterium]
MLLLVPLVLLALVRPLWLPAAPPTPRLVQVVMGFAWPELGRTAVFGQAWHLAGIEPLLDGGERLPATPDHRFPYWTVLLHFSDGSATEFILSRELAIFDPEAAAQLHHPRLEAQFGLLAGELAGQVFGEELTWSEVNRLFPPGAEAEVQDLETGLVFSVRRRGGDAHADVEPVTAVDAAVLRQIYQGEWSWKRRSAVVSVAGHRIAASMNGMPHGEGSIRDNDFPGHFCLHFSDSRVHRTWRVDRGHQLMVVRAAGRLAELLEAASPPELVAWLLTAVAHHERATYRYAGREPASGLWDDLATAIRHLDLIAVKAVVCEGLTAVVEADVLVYYRESDPDRPHRLTLAIPLSRNHPWGGWRVDLEALRPLLAVRATALPGPGADVECGCELEGHQS